MTTSVIVKTLNWTMSDAEWNLCVRYHISDRSRSHAEAVCRRCGQIIGKQEARIQFAARWANHNYMGGRTGNIWMKRGHMTFDSKTPVFSACLKESGEPLLIWSRHLDCASAIEKVKVKCSEMSNPSIGSWTAFVLTPTNERIWVAGDHLG